MSDRNALLAAILANPDEDTPRLVYADWLDEHGDALRAEFIRVQIQLARLREAERDLPENFGDQHTEYVNEGQSPFSFAYCRHHSPERIELLRREAALLTPHDRRAQWGAELPGYASGAGTSWCSFRRGFVGGVRASLTALMKAPAALWAHHPVEALALTSVSGRTTTAKVRRCSFFTRVRELSFPYTGGNFPLLEPFAECPHLAGLCSLHLDAGALSEVQADILARSEHLRPAHLNIQCSGLPRAAFEALVNSPFASRLRELTAESVGEWALEVVAAAPLDGLRQLRYAGCGDAGIAALTRSSI